MDLIAVFAYTNTAPLSPCSSTRRRAGCGTKSPTPGISILAEAEMATTLPGQRSRHVATGQPILEFWNPGKPDLELVNDRFAGFFFLIGRPYTPYTPDTVMTAHLAFCRPTPAPVIRLAAARRRGGVGVDSSPLAVTPYNSLRSRRQSGRAGMRNRR